LQLVHFISMILLQKMSNRFATFQLWFNSLMTALASTGVGSLLERAIVTRHAHFLVTAVMTIVIVVLPKMLIPSKMTATSQNSKLTKRKYMFTNKRPQPGQPIGYNKSY
jgi:hypothetical protein